MNRATATSSLAIAVAVLVACSNERIAPSGPSRPVIANFAGTWTGAVQQVSCHYWDPRTCPRSFPSNATLTLLLELRQEADTVSGTFDIVRTYPPGHLLQGTTHTTGELLGHVDEAGNLLLKSVVPSAQETDWHLRLLGGALTGAFTQIRPDSFVPSSPLIVEYELSGVARAR